MPTELTARTDRIDCKNEQLRNRAEWRKVILQYKQNQKGLYYLFLSIPYAGSVFFLFPETPHSLTNDIICSFNVFVNFRNDLNKNS